MTETHATRFRGKVAFVTGGSKGIGAGIVRRLASEDASVAFTYWRSEAAATQLVQELESKGSTALALKADNASAKSFRMLSPKQRIPWAGWTFSSAMPEFLLAARLIALASTTSIVWSPSIFVAHSSAFKQPPGK
jgi:NAD(P)-dependent dehydrogenase (short-subunit alcohol dehydrogenase family)